MHLVEVDCVDREATSAIFDFLPDRIGTFLTSYGLEVALHSIQAHGDAINERERLRVLRGHRGKDDSNGHDTQKGNERAITIPEGSYLGRYVTLCAA